MVDSRMVGSCGRRPMMNRSTSRIAVNTTRVPTHTQADTFKSILRQARGTTGTAHARGAGRPGGTDTGVCRRSLPPNLRWADPPNVDRRRRVEAGGPADDRVDDTVAREYSPPRWSFFTIDARRRTLGVPIDNQEHSPYGFLGG
ncbi:hypothetical protein GCM10027605_49020 [Micromonospora zhanjiangensis]